MDSDYLRTQEGIALAEQSDITSAMTIWRSLKDGDSRAVLAQSLVRALVKQGRFADAELVVSEHKGSSNLMSEFLDTYLQAARYSEAFRIASLTSSASHPQLDRATIYGFLAGFLALEGKSREASEAFEIASSAAKNVSANDPDEVRLAMTFALAGRLKYFDAVELADTIDDEEGRWEAYLLIIRAYTTATQRGK